MGISTKILTNFLELRNEIDSKCAKLHQLHESHTQCKNGCDQCCMNFNILPVEFEYILKKIKESKLSVSMSDSKKSCVFLKNHSCTIYKYRPIICRTHGLPILNMDKKGDNWELSFCPLNFKKVADDFFHFDNCYEQDYFNSKLYLLNNDFLNSEDGKKYKPNQMIELNELQNFI